MILRFLTRLFKRDNSYASIFSAALQEAVKETFKEMGYSCDKKDGKSNNENNTRDCNLKSDDDGKHSNRNL
jgi:hypothetical protein